MLEPLLLTKIYVPAPRPKIVLRRRLMERLNASIHCTPGVTLISAPAGFGKTTLVSEWASDCQIPLTWLSLDEGDDDPYRFLTYLVAALQTLSSQTSGINIGAEALAVLQSPQPPPVELILTTLLNDITAIPDNFVLILDDYHLIDSRPVDEALTFLIEHSPSQMHLVITTREDPALPLARLRARGRLVELRAAELRFTREEAAEFLNQVMGLNLTAEDIAALETRTEGWIAGLQLAALSMQGHQDTAHFIQAFTGSHHFVLDYLIEEVLQQQPEHIQTFLLCTALLNRLCGPLCDALLGKQETGQATLEYLERANLFIFPLDNERHWYRYHHLFGDILRQRLGQKLSPGEIAEYHLRASQWYERNGNKAEAFFHVFAAGDDGRAAELAELAWKEMDDTFQSAAWLGWVKKLPESEVRTRPVLCVQMAMAFMDAGEPEASESRLQDAERCLHGSPGGWVVVDKSQLESLPAMIAMTRAYNAQVQGDLAATAQYSKLALQLTPENDLFRRSQATIMLEVTYWARGDLEAARAGMGNWMTSMKKAGNYVFVVASAFALADIQIEQGHLREAITTYQQALRLAVEHPEARQITAHHYLGLAMLYHEMGKDALRDEHLQKARGLGEQTTLVDWSYRWHVAQARLKESSGDLESALAQLDEALRMYVKNPVPDTYPIEALKANLYLKQGRLDKAQDWVRRRELSVDDEINYLNEFEHLILARVLIAGCQNHPAYGSILPVIEMLERLQKAAQAQQRPGRVIQTLITLSLAHQAQGNIALALTSLERALTLAEPEGYLRLFVDEGRAVQSLISNFQTAPAVGQAPRMEKPSNGLEHPLHVYIERLLAAFAPPALAAGAKNPKSEMVEPLSERELEVLRLLRSELSGPEIAGQLVISPNTFRTHTKNIFSKLGVNNRRAAVRRAEELDLF